MKAHDFLADHAALRVRLPPLDGLIPDRLVHAPGNLPLEVLIAEAAMPPRAPALRQLWKQRQGGRAAPLLLVALQAGRASLCGPTGAETRIFDLEAEVAERICRRALAEPDRNAALRYLLDALPVAAGDSALLGVRNEGLLTDHVLAQAAADPSHAGLRRRGVPRGTDADLLRALGFAVEALDADTHVLRAEGQKRAVALLLRPGELEEVAGARFQRSSPIQWALARADRENLPWIVTVQHDRVRLYPRELGLGVGRRGRTETWIEMRTDLLRDEHAALPWLVFSAEALAADGAVERLLAESKRFAAGLAERLRERIYDRVVPLLASGIARARAMVRPSVADLRLTYAMALTLLFRLLFLAYAEDRDLLPYATNEAYRTRSLKKLAQEMHGRTMAGPAARLWDELRILFDAVRDGDAALGVPAYGGGLFATQAAASPAGAALAAISLPDAVMEPALRALLLDQERDLAAPSRGPVDFRSLRVREFGTIYEGLLESELALAEADLALQRQAGGKAPVYVPAHAGDRVEVPAGQVYLHDRSGARKSSGSYFTPGFAVDHLLDTALEPALDAHAARLAALDDTAAAEAFFDLRVADIAMGSGHFLVAAMDRLERRLGRLLVDRPLPGVEAELAALRAAAEGALGKLAPTMPIDRAQLLRRQIALRCIYGVDINPLAVDLARLSIWVHSFVPGLPLALLDHRLVAGNALVGVAGLEDARRLLTRLAGVGLPIEPRELLAGAEPHLQRLARIAEATMEDVQKARHAHAAAAQALGPASALFDAAVMVHLGRGEFRLPINKAIERDLVAGRIPDLRTVPEYAAIREAMAACGCLHMPIAFPEVFRRNRSGFDVVVGNPPWDKLRSETHEFWARHFPGLRGMKSAADRMARIAALRAGRPDLAAAEQAERMAAEVLRDTVRMMPGMNTGHPDLFRAFTWRFMQVTVAEGGIFGVVLPGEAFKVKGNAPVREALNEAARRVDVQFITNRAHWVFEDVDVRKSIALVAAELGRNGTLPCSYVLRPEHHRLPQFMSRDPADHAVRDAEWLRCFSPGLVQPTLPTAPVAASLEVIETFMRWPRLGDHPRLRVRRVYADIETTRDRDLHVAGPSETGWPIYGGDSFDLWQPDTRTYFAWADADRAFERVQRKRAASPRGAPYAETPRRWRDDPATHPCLAPRVAFRNVTNRTNHRTLVAALIPSHRVLVETAPWIVWLDPDRPLREEALLLGVMASVPADWWMRRFVETHVEEAAFEALPVPACDAADTLAARAIALAGRLAAPDERFAHWAAAVGVSHGPLEASTRQQMIEELDAVVARLYGLTPRQLTHVFDTFHEWPKSAEAAAWGARRDRTVAMLAGLP